MPDTTGIDEAIDAIEAMLTAAREPLFSRGMRLVDEAELRDRLDDLRDVAAAEVEDARRAAAEARATRDAAIRQADRIVADAQRQALVIAGEEEVARLARKNADETRAAARREADGIIGAAHHRAYETLNGLSGVIETVEGHTASARDAVRGLMDDERVYIDG